MAKPQIATGVTPGAVLVADLNRDGHQDVVTVDRPGLSVFPGNGDGTFKARMGVVTAGGATDAAAADFNHDQKLDLMVLSDSNGLDIGGFQVFSGDGMFGYTAGSIQSLGYFPSGLKVADLDGDGRLDVVVATQGVMGSQPGSVDVYLGTVTSFAAKSSTPSMGQPFDVTIADLDGNGLPDLIVSYQSDCKLGVFLSTGNGNFRAPVFWPVACKPWTVTTTDIDQDGNLDVVVSNNDQGALQFALGDGTGQLGAPQTLNPGGALVGVAVADYDGNGLLDLATCDAKGNALVVLLNNSK
jgi:hypothetical protein